MFDQRFPIADGQRRFKFLTNELPMSVRSVFAYERQATRRLGMLQEEFMSEGSADIVANAGDSVTFTFTAQAGGLTRAVTASLFVNATGDFTELPVVGNVTTMTPPNGVPAGDSIVQITLFLGPQRETGSLSISVNRGASVDFFQDRPLFTPIVEIDLFGK